MTLRTGSVAAEVTARIKCPGRYAFDFLPRFYAEKADYLLMQVDAGKGNPSALRTVCRNNLLAVLDYMTVQLAPTKFKMQEVKGKRKYKAYPRDEYKYSDQRIFVLWLDVYLPIFACDVDQAGMMLLHDDEIAQYLSSIGALCRKLGIRLVPYYSHKCGSITPIKVSMFMRLYALLGFDINTMNGNGIAVSMQRLLEWSNGPTWQYSLPTKVCYPMVDLPVKAGYVQECISTHTPLAFEYALAGIDKDWLRKHPELRNRFPSPLYLRNVSAASKQDAVKYLLKIVPLLAYGDVCLY